MNWQSWIRERLKEAQDGTCPVCEKPLEGRTTLDHDHSTGEIRGLVHQKCNNQICQVETGTRKMNYIVSRKTEARIRAYLQGHIIVKVTSP